MLGLKQRIRWLLERRGGWCLVRVIFIVIIINAVGGGENNFWQPWHNEERGLHLPFQCTYRGYLGVAGGQEYHKTFL